MNKTVNINLGGIFFHIDEDAYLKLTRYFDAIKRSLNSSSGQEEIIKDIEMRVSELLTEKQQSDKHVVGLKDVDEVIAVMGQPEDYIIEDDFSSNQQTNYTKTKSKKLYRDTEKGMIGGVATGLGHYFGVDAVWLKIMFLIFVFAGFGTGIIAYIILWAVTPAALTTSEKLEMTGEPVNITNIERKVREEIENLSDKFKNADYDKMGNHVKSGAGRLGTTFGDLIIRLFKIFAKILGIVLVVSGITMLVFLFIGVFTLGTNIFVEFPWQRFIEAGNFTDYPIWSFGLLMLFAVGIPFFFLMILGFKLISPNSKTIGNIVKYVLLAVWIISIALLISIGVKQATEVSFENKVATKETLNLLPTDTLYVKFRYNDYYSKNINHHSDFEFVQDSAGTALIYSNDVHLHVLYTDTNSAYIQVEKNARGKSFADARERAKTIQYKTQIVGNQIILDNYFVTDVKNKFRGQEVDVYLYLPQGQLLKPDASIQDYDDSDDDFFNLHYSSDNYIYKVYNHKVKCLNCPADENEYDDIDTVEEYDTDNDSINNVSVKINGKEVVKFTKTDGHLAKDKNGMIIKIN